MKNIARQKAGAEKEPIRSTCLCVPAFLEEI
jgi:hypothetical protein